MRLRTALAVAALALAAAACGGSGAPSDHDRVAATVRAFARATQAGDYERLCRDLLSTALVTRIQRAGITCRDALQVGLQGVRAPRLSVGAIRVDGDRATAEVRTSAAGQRPSVDRLRLVREAGGWRIASLQNA